MMMMMMVTVALRLVTVRWRRLRCRRWRLLLLHPLESGGHRRRGGHPFVVDPGVFGPVIGPRKPFVAQVTTVRLDARVRPTVPGQLVRPRETPLAPRPHATVRFLARMPPHVNLQTRAQNDTTFYN